MNRKKISLAGSWQFSVPGGVKTKRRVPGSYYCVGESVYERSFTYEKPSNMRTLLCFEGIAYEGKVKVNGSGISTLLLPYSQYHLDVTDMLCNGENRVELELEDIRAVFGPANGWSCYGGIIRDVYLLEVPQVYVDNVFFHAKFSEDYHTAYCTVEVGLSGNTSDIKVEAVLKLDDRIISSSDIIDGKSSFIVTDPQLWTPDTPTLYQLKVTAGIGGIQDSVCEMVGFKEFLAKGNTFELNGKRIFLAGVCRHDLWEEPDGFTQTDTQIELDMQMIKATGANFVRLVHYPHDKRVLDAADRIGLLVSGEPGFWWSDMTNQEVVDKGMQVMENLIHRDRNHAALAFWLTFNECVLNLDFLIKMTELVRKHDPYHLVSGANCMYTDVTKEWFTQCGFDFYTFHPYGPEPGVVTGGVGPDWKWGRSWQAIKDVSAYLSDKPLIFTEWGGYYVHNNPVLFHRFCDLLIELGHNDSPKPVLAGMSYWAWSDIHEANREPPSSRDGMQIEGLVDIKRRPRVN